MVRYILRRLPGLLAAFAFASLVAFFVVRLVPGNPVDLLIGPTTPPDMRDRLIAQYGLEKPVMVQYGMWMSSLMSGDLGLSVASQRPVAGLIAEQLPDSLLLGSISLAVSMGLGILLGIVAVARRGSLIDRAAMGFAILSNTIPGFWLGLLLILVFAVQLEWFPVSGADGIASLVLPVATLSIAGAGLVAKVTRASVVETSAKDFVMLLRARGFSSRYIFWRHILRNAMVPIIAVFGLRIGWIIGGAVPVEVVFARPGVGSLLLESITRRDYPVVQSLLFLLSTAVLTGTFLADILHAWVDPRVRTRTG